MSKSEFVNEELQEALLNRHVRSTYPYDSGGIIPDGIIVGGRKVRIGQCGSLLGSSPYDKNKGNYVLCIETKEKSMKKVIELLEDKFNEIPVLEKLFWKDEQVTQYRIHLNIGIDIDDKNDCYDGKTEQKATFYIYACSEGKWDRYYRSFWERD